MNEVTHSLLLHHENFLVQLLQEATIPAVKIREAMQYVLFPGGKRLRPMLVYLTGELFNIPLATLDPIAAAIEITHCYSLVHDDLPAMDNDDFRRGKPSCHRAFDEATAVLVGDGMQAWAIEILLTYLTKTLSPQQVIAITHALIKATGPSGMVSGQSLDLSEMVKPSLTEDQLKTIHALKTGCLIATCIEMVLIAANPSIEVKKTLQTFAENLGLVFQMQDDYLDAFGAQDLLGKGRASDAANHKITFANLYDQLTLKRLIRDYFLKIRHNLLSLSTDSSNLLIYLDFLFQRTERI